LGIIVDPSNEGEGVLMSHNPGHAFNRAVRSLPRWARAGILATATAGSITGLAVAAVPAGAVVSPTTVYNKTGWAGYYSVPNAHQLANGDRVTGVRTQFYLRLRAETTKVNLGVELCRPSTISTNGETAVLFAKWNAGTGVFDVFARRAFNGNCLSSMNTNGATKLDSIPAGHTLFLAITQNSHSTVFFTDVDLTTNTGGFSTFGGFSFRGFRLAGVGSNGVQAALTEPAVNKLVAFRKTAVRDHPGWAAINRVALTRMVITKVVDTGSGTNAPPVLLKPVKLVSDGFTLLSGNL
jgi:hypothetical protein